MISRVRNLAFSPSTAFRLGEPFFSFMGMRKGRRPVPKEAQSVLVVKLDEIGDAVLLTPFMRALRAHLPNAWITLVVKPQLEDLWETCPYLSELLTYDRPVGPPNIKSHSSAFSFAKEKLWKRKFDLAIVPRWDSDLYNASYLAYFSGARIRIGYSEKVIGHKALFNKGYDRLFTEVSSDSALKHESERNLDLLKAIGLKTGSTKTELWVNNKDISAADALLASNGISTSDRFACIYPSGGSSVLKQWPASNFIALGRSIFERYGLKVLVAGGPGDEAVCREVSKGIGQGAHDLCGGLGLRIAAAIFKRSELFVGNDTGPTHIAAAMGATVLAIFGASCPHRFAPVGANCRAISKDFECSACHKNAHADRCATCIYEKPACLDAVTVEEIKGAVEQVLKSRA